MINCVIIYNDDKLDDRLEGFIINTPNLKLIKTYNNSFTALKELSSGPLVDAIFIDIDMPGISGLQLGKALRDKTNKLIFMDFGTEYGFEAFEADGDAYLLKPYNYAKFAHTINRLFPTLNNVASLNKQKENYFLVKDIDQEHKAVAVKYSDLIAFESFNNYIKIHTTTKLIIAYLSLKDVREKLQLGENFKQFHRAYIISVAQIANISSFSITMTNNLSFNVGNSYRSEFKEALMDKILTTSRNKT